MAEFLEFISIDPWHILFTWINLLLLVLLLKKFLFKPVNAILAKRQAEVDGMYSDAQQAQKAALADKELYAQKLQGAQEEASGLIKAAAARAQDNAQALLEETQRQTRRMRERAEADIAQERLAARAQLQDEVSQMVVDLAGKVIGRELNAADQADLIDGFIGQVAPDAPQDAPQD